MKRPTAPNIVATNSAVTSLSENTKPPCNVPMEQLMVHAKGHRRYSEFRVAKRHPNVIPYMLLASVLPVQAASPRSSGFAKSLPSGC